MQMNNKFPQRGRSPYKDVERLFKSREVSNTIQIEVLSQTQNTVDAVYINLLQNLQNVIIC